MTSQGEPGDVDLLDLGVAKHHPARVSFCQSVEPSAQGTCKRSLRDREAPVQPKEVMPPVLDPSKSKVDGLAFLGLSLARHSEQGHPDSVTHQTSFDLNRVIDRDYTYVFSTNDDGWLVGGGEPGPPKSYKLAAKDSAHVEILRIGTFNPEWGGLTVKTIVAALQSGQILIPQIEVVPTAVVANPDLPPELEIRFDMDPPVATLDAPLPVNWQLRFVHNQLFKLFQFPSRFCPGAFHSTIVRKAEFRSPQHRSDYFAMCDKAIAEWKKDGPKPLVPSPKALRSKGVSVVKSKGSSEKFQSGIWLFTDRENITHYFAPNFLPPYDDPKKKEVILEFLSEEWDEKALAWKPAAPADEEEAGCSLNIPKAPKVDEALNETTKKVDQAFDETFKYIDGLIDRMFQERNDEQGTNPANEGERGLYSRHKFTQ